MDRFDLCEGVGENEDISDLCLIGQILVSKTLNKQAVSNILRSAWRPREALEISPWWENVYLFQFEDHEDRKRVLSEAPWSVMRSLLVLQPFLVSRSAAEMEFNWCSFWVQAHGVPMAKMTSGNAEIISKRIGNLIGVEVMHDGLLLNRSFLRMRVELDVSKPLPLGFILQHNVALGQASKETWVQYKYEKLTDFCYDYRRIGHENSMCKFVSRDEGKKSGYGPQLRTSRAPNLNVPMEQMKH
ncbi:hypothetical protein CsSME_00050864 [Camellia sinensis var. sinensis]